MEFGAGQAEIIALYSKLFDVVENQHIVWTNDVGAAGTIATENFEDLGKIT
jgi:hypothetical protein